MDEMSTQETRECLLCLRIPLESIRITVETLLTHVDDAVIDRVAERAAKLIASAYEKDRIALCGKKPSGLMAAAIYLSGRMEEGINLSQGTVAWALKLTTPTISTRAHQINDLLGLGIMEQHSSYVRSERRKQYACPFCEKTFTSLSSIKRHLQKGREKNTSMLQVRMFNEAGIMVNENMLEELKSGSDTCERPPVAEIIQIKRPLAVDVANIIRGQGSGLSYFGQGDPLATRRRYNS